MKAVFCSVFSVVSVVSVLLKSLFGHMEAAAGGVRAFWRKNLIYFSESTFNNLRIFLFLFPFFRIKAELIAPGSSDWIGCFSLKNQKDG